MSDPLVTALMITGKCPERVPMARVAAACFRDQTYHPRALVIVNHGPAPLGVPGAAEFLADKSRPHLATLGQLRNLARDLAAPGLVIIWDDDDWFAPDYMATLVGHWRPGHIVTYATQIRHDLEVNSSFLAVSAGGHHGQVLYHRDEPYRYRALECGEDTTLLNDFGHHRRVVVRNHPEIYVRTAHSFNTWDRHHIMRGLERRPNTHVGLTPALRQLVRRVRRLYGKED